MELYVLDGYWVEGYAEGDSVTPEPEIAVSAPGGGYAPWEYKRLDRIRDEMEAERIAKDKATLDELSEAYDRVNGLIEEAKQEEQAVERKAVAQVMLPAPAPVEAQDFSALIAELIQLKQEIERDIADEDEAVSLLLMVA